MAELTSADQQTIARIRGAIPESAIQQTREVIAAQECYLRELRSSHNIAQSGEGSSIHELLRNPALKPEETMRLRDIAQNSQASIRALQAQGIQAAVRLGVNDRVVGDPPASLTARAVDSITSELNAAACVEAPQQNRRESSLAVPRGRPGMSA